MVQGGGEESTHDPAALSPGKKSPRYPLNRRMRGFGAEINLLFQSVKN
jgi:hypothetical protein